MTSKMKKEREILLRRMEKELNAGLIPARLTSSEDGSSVLNVMFDEIAAQGLTSLGEYFFLPNEEEDEVQVFNGLVTICEELEAENLSELFKAVSVLNFFVTLGAFAIDPVGKRLVYKLSRELPIPEESEKMYELIDLTISMSVQMVQNFAGELVQVNEGTLTAEKMTEGWL